MKRGSPHAHGGRPWAFLMRDPVSTNWSTIDIGGKLADVFEPAAGRFALLYLHPEDGRTPAADPAFTSLLARHGLRCVAPHGGRSWWVDRVCPEFDPALTTEQHLLRNVVPWMVAQWSLGPRGVAVCGVEMGGQGAVRLGFRHPDRFPVVASVGGAFDFHERHGRGTPLDAMYDSREQCRQDTAVLQLDPYRWPPHIFLACDPADRECYRGNDRLHEKLTALGVPHTADLDTTAGGDPQLYAARMVEPVLRFILTGLERESRRLV